MTEHKKLLTLGNQQGVVEREVGGGTGWLGDRHRGVTWQDEYWVLFCKLANWTAIKNKFIIKKRNNNGQIYDYIRKNPGNKSVKEKTNNFDFERKIWIDLSKLCMEKETEL